MGAAHLDAFLGAIGEHSESVAARFVFSHTCFDRGGPGLYSPPRREPSIG